MNGNIVNSSKINEEKYFSSWWNNHLANNQGLNNSEIYQNNTVVFLINGQIKPYIFHYQNKSQSEKLSQWL